MYTESYLQYLLSDDASLQQYYVRRKQVPLEDIKRNLMLIERDNDHHIPDHYYRLGKEKSFDGIKHLSHLFTIGLKRLADHYLEIRNERVYVKAEKMNNWQMILPYMPPLLLVCTKLNDRFLLENGKEIDFVEKYLKPNIAFTAYPSPYIPQLDEFLDDGGLPDLHMHLNGALETDLTWQDFLNNPLEIKNELAKAYSNEKVKEQYAQSSFLSDPERFYYLLKVAVELRYLLYCYAYHVNNEDATGSLENLLQKVATLNVKNGSDYKHPMKNLFGCEVEDHYLEAILYIRILKMMELNPDNDTITALFHYYLLILGLANKMMVQQPNCYGFEEFQKVTLNGLREYSESKNYFLRYAQLSGNQLKYVKLLEGRFSPKDDQNKNKKLVENIILGWEQLQKVQESHHQPKSTLRLVAHFIKRKEGKRDEFVRYKAFRQDIDHRADLLSLLVKNSPSLSNVILGIDAASSEFDTPPECFAPVYKKLRSKGFSHFTYHAGEDFFHVLSGLRAIYEAVHFLDLQRCDRIGHATAAGVPVNLWYNNVGHKILIRKGEYLDDLIFAYHMITLSDDEKLRGLLPVLALKIDEFSYDIYNDYNPLSMHIKVWQSRYRDPMELLLKDQKDLNREEKLYLEYHSKKVADRYDEIIEIDTYDILGEEHLTMLQLLLLKELHRREIVIETLPTSNVIIGNHHDYSTYHLYNWYLWKKENHPLPPIVVGTDDVGIFATNIFNEYSNIYCQFLYDKGLNSNEIIDFLKELNDNAKHYAFVE